VKYIEKYLSKESHRIESERLGLNDRLTSIKETLEFTNSNEYLNGLEGTIGCDISL
jgi:hypothetical protein